MINTLGGWFATTYSSQFSNPNVTFRCSKSGRAKESGNDFMAGFNKALSKEVMLNMSAAASVMSLFVSYRLQKRDSYSTVEINVLFHIMFLKTLPYVKIKITFVIENRYPYLKDVM